MKAGTAKEAAKEAAKAGRFSRAETLLDKRPTAFHPDEAPAATEPAADAAPVAEATKASKREGRFERVPVHLISPNPHNARRIYRPQRIGELAESLVANGQMQPGMATRRGDRYVLVAGHYRLAACKQAGLPTIDVMVHEGLTDRDLFEYSYRENSERDGQSALDDSMAWKSMLDAGLYPNETELASAVRKSLATVNRTLSIQKLSAPVLDLVGQNPDSFPMSSLAELVQYEAVAGVKAALEMAERVGEGEIGRKEINEARVRIEAPKERKPKEISRQYKLRLSDGRQVGVVKEWDSGRVSLDVVVESPAERLELLSLIKTRFSVAE
ncbi:MAG: ParB/RepB/Spo0J family partition protein [Hydrogenophaga sp.]|uniref:ParB/RepB/Spo0J family partition protein n=1 Tax=Hydrogenophaga sp. TaxID=1904254 RepID=UPI002AB97A71|nr:ParB/RepB/Spo0J family partition protein [Hydrogenophaga sp.]MDZ4283882.1 ParB/RepB/Spo0J family partition protein [Hydrogenophaga sp.]